ncbi:hypothetical protein EMIHUDRAFT_367376, partial [Emiliania huxleyi CCMP1516]|uniref:Uncharacterized protein n=2 Tax=Emiliania huxleyi TaxID=2903 RepID=A0A0D3JPI7_EMIH1
EPLHAAAVAGPLQRYTTLREQVEARVELLDATLAGLDPSRLSAGVELRCGDLFAADVSSADVVFCCCVTWSVSIMQRLAAKLAA